MPIYKVTITGADSGTKIPEMLELSKEFPFVEWGILVSKMRLGTYRFPGLPWIQELSKYFTAWDRPMQLAVHLCGGWTRDLLTGSLNWDDLAPLIEICDRVQINTHGEPHVVQGYVENLQKKDKEYIFQWEPANKHLVFAPLFYGVRCSVLFDTSGGAGIVPRQWPASLKKINCGYAGGLGPDNVLTEIERIENVVPPAYLYWIDMERRVRSADDSRLDMEKVRSVLEQCKPLIKTAEDFSSFRHKET